MKEQKLSTVNRRSLWSELPPEIIHHIISFLPTTRDAAKTCLISKCWLHAWRSYFEGPSLIFIIGRDAAYQKIEHFCAFVDHTMSRFDNRKSRKMQKFVLDVPALENYNCLNEWINIAIDNHVEEMTLLKIWYPFNFLKRVLNNESLRSLNLDLWTSPNANSINLPNVVTLTLSMRYFSVGFLDRFLKGCPLLETVTIGSDDYQRASEIKVTGCDHLKTVHLRVQDLKLVHIDAPNLETLRCSTIKTGEGNVLSIDNCLKLKFLDLEFFTLDAKWFEGFLPQLDSLETLKLKFENSSTKGLFFISNPSIKNIVLDRCTSPNPFIIVNVLKLSHFRYVGRMCSYPYYSGVSVDHPNECIAHFMLMLDCRNFCWLSKLWETIHPFSNLRSLWLVYCGKGQEIGSWWEDVNLPSTVVEIELLKLTIDDAVVSEIFFFSKFNKLLSGLFSICHPAILTIEASGKNGHNEITRKDLKLLGENVIINVAESSCWKPQPQLKEVKIKEDEFILEEWSAVNISFMLKW